MLYKSGPQVLCDYDRPEKWALGIWPSLDWVWAVWVNPLCTGMSPSVLYDKVRDNGIEHNIHGYMILEVRIRGIILYEKYT
jgi:hypothetical protein